MKETYGDEETANPLEWLENWESYREVAEYEPQMLQASEIVKNIICSAKEFEILLIDSRKITEGSEAGR